jgi:hypothetical protein
MSRQTPFLVLFLALVAAAILAAGGAAKAASDLEKNFWLEGPRYDGNVPPCEAALGKVARQFAQKEGKYWNSALQITGFAKVREIALQPWTSATIPRRYCTAQAAISDGRVRRVNFSVIEDGGFAAFGSGVEFCVVGLDRNWAYSPGCRMARP